MNSNSRLSFAIPLLVFGVVFSPQRSDGSAGTESAAFLDIPVGAGPAALAGAYSALATDAYALQWNPAGLGFLTGTQIASQHLSYLESIHYEQISIVHSLKEHHAFGLSAQYLGSGDITGRDDTGALTQDYSDHYGAYALGYGHAFTEAFSLGLTARVIEAQLSDVRGHAYAADAGALYKPNAKLTLAAVIAQAGSKLQFLQEAESLPLQARLGLAYQPDWHWTLALETGYHPKSHLAFGRLGLQWKPISMIAIRAGYKTDATQKLDGLTGLTAGMGLYFLGQELAYAWVPYGELGNTQYISLILRFGVKEEGRRNLIQYQQIKGHAKASGGKDPEYEQLIQLLNEEDLNPSVKSAKGVAQP